MPRVSVVVPAHNSEQYIARALESISDQTARDFEVVVIDDGSTDSTSSIVQAAAAKDPRIQLHYQPHSGKPAIARNRGLSVARGEFVCFLDSDDLYCPAKITRGLEVLDRYPDTDLVFHDVEYIDASGAPLSGSYLGASGFRDHVLPSCTMLTDDVYLCDRMALFVFMCTRITTLHTSAVLLRSVRLKSESVLFPEDLTVGEDVDLWFRIVTTSSVAYIDAVLSSYRQHAHSLTKRPDQSRNDRATVHVRNYLRSETLLDRHQRKMYRYRIAGDLFELGYAQLHRGNRRAARTFYLASLKWHWRPTVARAMLATFMVSTK